MKTKSYEQLLSELMQSKDFIGRFIKMESYFKIMQCIMDNTHSGGIKKNDYMKLSVMLQGMIAKL